jgi:hypothetical protein
MGRCDLSPGDHHSHHVGTELVDSVERLVSRSAVQETWPGIEDHRLAVGGTRI